MIHLIDNKALSRAEVDAVHAMVRNLPKNLAKDVDEIGKLARDSALPREFGGIRRSPKRGGRSPKRVRIAPKGIRSSPKALASWLSAFGLDLCDPTVEPDATTEILIVDRAWGRR
jgi:hypothetical protein